MGLSAVVSIVVIVGVAIAAAAAIGGAFRTGRATQAITNYRSLAESWQATAEKLEAEKAEQIQQIATLAAQVDWLQKLASGKAQIEQMMEQFETLTARVDNQVGEILNQVGAVRADMRALARTRKAPDHG